MQIIVQNRPADPLHPNECDGDGLTSINDIRNGMTLSSNVRGLMQIMHVAVLVVRLVFCVTSFVG